MKTQEYIGEVMPDGHLSLPEKVAKGLGLEPYARVRVIIGKVEHGKRNHVLSYEAKRKGEHYRFFSQKVSNDGHESFYTC